jgi:hypothetical protein
VGGGAESDFDIREERLRTLPRRRYLVVFALALAGASLWTAAFGWSRFENVFDWLSAIGAVGRGFAVVVGGLGLIVAVGYYYTAGIDWPRETAGRLLVIGSGIGVLVLAAIAGVVALEGRLAELSSFLWTAALILGFLGLVGVLLQRA